MAAAEKTNPMNAESQMPGKEKELVLDMIGGLAGKHRQAEKNAMFGYLGGPCWQSFRSCRWIGNDESVH